MRSFARRFRGSLLTAIVIGAGASLASAQELQLDPKALDGSGAAASATAKRKGKKADAAAPQAQAAGKPQSGGPNRQFGELEGWSPGKAPPRPKDKYDPEPTGKKEGGMPVGMSPSGNMSVGLPF